MNMWRASVEILQVLALGTILALSWVPGVATALVLESDSLQLVDALGDVLMRPTCPGGVCQGSRSETGNEFPATLTVNVPAPPAGQSYVSNVLSLFEGDVNIISDRVRLVPRPGPGGTVNLSVSFLSDSLESGLPFGPEVINIPEEPGVMQDLTGSLFSLSSAQIQADPPFRILFGSDCGSPGPDDVCGILPIFQELPPDVVPEPSSVALLGVGVALVMSVRRHRRRG
jgi:PEP-CTERM motif-containing protein